MVSSSCFFETLLLLIFTTLLFYFPLLRVSLLLHSRVMRRVCDLIITLCYSVFVVVVVVVVLTQTRSLSFSSNLAALLVVGDAQNKHIKKTKTKKNFCCSAFVVMSGGARTRAQKRRIGERDSLWDLIVNNDDICFKHILPRLNRTDVLVRSEYGDGVD